MSELSAEEAQKKAWRLLKKRNMRDLTLETAEGGDSNHTFLADQELVIKIEKNKSWHGDILREAAILELLASSENVKVPEVVDSGHIGRLSYLILTYLDGENFDKYSSGKNFHKFERDKKLEVSKRMGKQLAKIHESNSFAGYGVLDQGGEVKNTSAQNWSKGLLDLQDWWFDELRDVGYSEIVDQVRDVLRDKSGEIDRVEESCLLHMEFDFRNTLFQEDEIVVLDWEYAAAGDPLLDFIMTEKRLFWIDNEDLEVKQAFRKGYKEVREINIQGYLPAIYELVQMTRFLLIFRKNDGMEDKILSRIDELLDSWEVDNQS